MDFKKIKYIDSTLIAIFENGDQILIGSSLSDLQRFEKNDLKSQFYAFSSLYNFFLESFDAKYLLADYLVYQVT